MREIAAGGKLRRISIFVVTLPPVRQSFYICDRKPSLSPATLAMAFTSRPDSKILCTNDGI
jgi:hypothetical protein